MEDFINLLISWKTIIYIFSILFTLILCIKIIYNFKSYKNKLNFRLDGKTIIITGGSSGIGKAAAFDFAFRGARVVLACRNESKTLQVTEEIINATGNKKVVFYHLDTSDLKSVRSCAKKILSNEKWIHVLINNAGTCEPSEKKLTSDGLEYIMATNHYGHFLFTNILLGRLKECPHSRIINVSSSVHQMCSKLDPEDLNFDKSKFSSMKAYSQSKLCNILFTLELSKKLQGTGITVNSLHPGLVDTEIFAKSTGFIMQVGKWFVPLFGKTANIGAQTTIYLAVSEDVAGVTGNYFVDCKAVKPLHLGSHSRLAQKLWLASELDVKLEEDETHYMKKI